MARAFLCPVAVLLLFAVGVATADEAKNKNDKNKDHDKATITKVDATKGTVTVKMKDKDGKEVEKTFHLAAGAEYLDGNGKAAKIDAFQAGDHVLFTEKDGQITELKKGKDHARATITNVDAKKGTVTVKMKDKDGKEVEKTFHLTEDAEYLDSTGKVATIDVFRSGDEVLIVEQEGRIKELKKDTKGTKSGDKDKTSADKDKTPVNKKPGGK